MNKNVFFVTNNSTKTRQQFGQKARNLNFNVKPDFMISTAYLAAKYLAASNFSKKVYVIGSPAIGLELDSVNIKHVGIGVYIFFYLYLFFELRKTNFPN